VKDSAVAPQHLPFSSALFAVLFAGIAPVDAQVEGEVGRYSDVTIENSVLEPEKIEVSDDWELTGLL